MNQIKMNQSDFERFGRIIVGGVLMLAATYVPLSLLLQWALVLVGLTLMLTGLAGHCPLYAFLNISAKKRP